MKNFYENFTVKSLFNDSMIKTLIAYLVKNPVNILPPNQQEIIFKEKTISNDLISKLYREIEKTDIPRMFSLLYPPRRTPLPEVVTYSSFLIDFEQLHDFNPSLVSVAKSYDEYKGKNVINITPYVKTDLLFSDQSEFQQRVLRDVLSKSYFLETKCWIKPILKIIGKIYSITLSKPIASAYNLSATEYMILNSIFLLYFLTITSSTEYAKNIMRSFNSYFGILDNTQLDTFFSQIDDILKHKPLTNFLDIFECAKKLLPERVGSLSYSVLALKIKKIGNDSVASMIASEYPPYFVYLVIVSLSKIKTGLSYRIKDYLSPKEIDQIDRYFSLSPECLNKILHRRQFIDGY